MPQEEMKSVPMQPELTINDLKAAVYDKIAEMENYQRAIQQVQKEIGDLNQQIIQKQQQLAKAETK